MWRIRLFVVSLLALLSACEESRPEWSAQELKIIASLDLARLSSSSSVSNRYVGEPLAIAFGKQLFFDRRLSSDQSISCASCHQPELAYTDGLNQAQGIRASGRNTQTILGVSHQDWFYWDGRKDSLWAQALVPFEAAGEMAGSRVQVLRTVGSDVNYRRLYETLFGKFPDLVYHASIPAQAGPLGDKATQENWYRVPPATQKVINQAYANLGKSIEAFERSLPVPETRFDRFVSTLQKEGAAESHQILNEDERAGLRLFIDASKTPCLRCHNGPLFTNGDFHNIGSGTLAGQSPDLGRYLGVQAIVQDEFNCLGIYSDAQDEDCASLNFLQNQVHDELKGAFKTPTLRYLGKTAPYFHDGRFTSLEQVMAHYLAQPGPGSELPELSLTAYDARQLLAFLRTLN